VMKGSKPVLSSLVHPHRPHKLWIT